MNSAIIMVSLDLGPAAANRVQLAASLAKRFDAELIGVATRQIHRLRTPRASARPFSATGG